jgi:hypothetical protein
MFQASAQMAGNPTGDLRKRDEGTWKGDESVTLCVYYAKQKFTVAISNYTNGFFFFTINVSDIIGNNTRQQILANSYSFYAGTGSQPSLE